MEALIDALVDASIADDAGAFVAIVLIVICDSEEKDVLALKLENCM